MKKFAAVLAIATACVATSAFAGGEKAYYTPAPAPVHAPVAYHPAPAPVCAPVAPACGPSFNPFEIVGGVVSGVGHVVGGIGNGIANIFACNPC